MKKNLGPVNYLYPMPVVLVGAMVEGKPNYLTVAHVGIIDFETVSISLGSGHYSCQGIRQNKAFSVNFPTQDMVKQTDYCGMVSGKNHDKAALFTNRPGEITGAPLIEECPLCLECRLEQVISRHKHDVFLGQVVAAWCDERCITDDAPDLVKMRPLLFAMNDKAYWSLGRSLAAAWSVGKELKGE
jgi:flavin reductase (DIM6/NTAB) family NADH-FMN oxidoreductase RutF